jgi:hypothetical protein
MAYDTLHRMITSKATWQINWQMLQAIDHISHRARQSGKNSYALVEPCETVISPLKPPWPVARRELLKSREERIHGNGGKNWGKPAERGLVRVPSALGEPCVDKRFP